MSKLPSPFLIVAGILCPPIGILGGAYWIINRGVEQGLENYKKEAVKQLVDTYQSKVETLDDDPRPGRTCDRVLLCQNGVIEVFANEGIYRAIRNDGKEIKTNFNSIESANKALI